MALAGPAKGGGGRPFQRPFYLPDLPFAGPALLFAVLTACGRGDLPKPPAPNLPPPGAELRSEGRSKPADFDKWPADKRVFWEKLEPKMKEAWLRGEETRPYELAQEAKDRAELVRSAPPGFKPEPEVRKVRLTLVPQKIILRAGESFWYRLEMQNVGRDPLDVHDAHFKSATLFRVSGTHFEFWVTLADGKELQVPPPFLESLPPGGIGKMGVVHFPGEERMTPAELDHVLERMNLMARLEREVHITLHPGETVFTRPWKYTSVPEALDREQRGLEPFPRPTVPFRELHSELKFVASGRYRIRAVLNDLPPPVDEDEIRDLVKETGKPRQHWLQHKERTDRLMFLGRAESEPVDFTVVP